jgi:hypothetical protein
MANSACDSYFIECINELNLIQKICKPTRESNILDLIFCNRDDFISDVNVCETFSTSDHCYITCNFNVPALCSQEVKTCLNFRDVDWELVRVHLATIYWEEIFIDCTHDCNSMWTWFKSIIVNIVQHYIPTIIVSKNINNAPWFNHYLRKIIKTKQQKWNKYKHSLSQ